MIEIDGSYGEGGGQILRTSLALSALTRQPVRVHRIRAGRKPPGLKPQHLMSALAAAQICNGQLQGLQLGATELIFRPGPIRPGHYTFDVGSVKASAGSTSLIFQTLLHPLLFAGGPSRLLLKGGTHVPWSPPADYLKEVFLPTMSGMGVRVKMEILMRGFYPIGGGTLDVTVEPLRTPLRPFRIEKRGELKQLSIVSMAAHLPLSIAKRQLDRAMARLAEHEFEARGESLEVESPGKGTFCFILAAFENVRAGFSSLGEIGKRAENVADEAVEAFLRFWSGRGALDRHLSDQVALPMALADGESEVTVSKVTEHLKTNIWVIEQFLPVKFHLVEDPALGGGSLRVTGAALRAAKGGQRL